MKTGFFTGYRRYLLPLVVVLSLCAVLVTGKPVQAAPAITLSQASVAAGAGVTITGTVFDSYKGDRIYIYFDDVEIDGSPLIVPETGTFTIDFTVPGNATPGTHWVRVYGDAAASFRLAETSLIVEESIINLDINDGPVGTTVTISGSGFYSGRTVTLHYYNIVGEKLGTTTASSAGQFSYKFDIPASPGGIHKITATNAEGNTAQTQFNVLPLMALNLATAGPGDLVNIKGTGFGYRSKVNVTFGTYTVATAKTDDFGSFEVTFNVPDVKPIPYDIKAQDEKGNVDLARFTVIGAASLSQTTGSIGSPLTVQGGGFTAGETVNIDYDNLRVATTKADGNGAFTALFNIPPSASGSHVITVSSGTITRKFAFTVESDAPPAPELLLPAKNGETGAVAYLDWQDVTDTSLPVTYNLQIASDQNFSSLVLDKAGLGTSEYTLTKEEVLTTDLKDTPYFWRVKARDAASNESEWSAPRSFYISPPPLPALQQPTPEGTPEKPILFKWQAVTNLSPPISYNLQVATDPDFTSIFFEIEGLTDSEYLITEEDEPELKKEQVYYWRVKAIDSASNESDWSAPSSFSVASSFSFPGWAIYTLIGIGVIIIAFLAFRAGRRTAYRPPD
jgi:hypothetical protein